MSKQKIFIFAAAGFVLGASLGATAISPAQAAILAGLAVLAFSIFSRNNYATAAVAAVCFFAGAFYYGLDDYSYRTGSLAMKSVTRFQGRVIEEPVHKNGSQRIIIRVTNSDSGQEANGKIFVYTKSFPPFNYGDVVEGVGQITLPPKDSYGNYLAKEKIRGIALSPKLTTIDRQPNIFFSALFGIRARIKTAINSLFAHQEAAFLAGIMLGDREEFSQEFLDKLSVSGTTHLTALSGLHMAIIIFIALSVFTAVFAGKKRPIFAATFTLVGLFVAMNGFQVSAIRASLMAFLAGLAGQTERLYSPGNAIALAALVITLINPKAPAFDLGFQLSFAATLAIIYFTPVLKQLRFFRTEGFLSWRGILAVTIAAQVGVAPITIISFGNFSFTSLLANIAILIIIPLLMALGFATIAASAVFLPAAQLLSMPTAFLLNYASSVVEIFAAAKVSFNPSINLAGAALYYILFIWLCWRFAPPIKTDNDVNKQKISFNPSNNLI